MHFLYVWMWLEKENHRTRTGLIPQALSPCYHKASAITCNKSYNLHSRLFILYPFSNVSGAGECVPQTCSNNAVKQRANTGVETMTVPRLVPVCRLMNHNAAINADLFLSALPLRHNAGAERAGAGNFGVGEMIIGQVLSDLSLMQQPLFYSKWLPPSFAF